MMFKKRGLILVAVSLVLGLGAALVASSWMQSRTPDAEDGSTSHIASAAMAIPYGTKIELRHVKMVPLPGYIVPDGAIKSIDEIKGKIATADILSGELLMNGRFVNHDEGSTLAALVEEKKRAITVRVDDVVGVAGFLLPGNSVDVLASRLERGTRRAITETILVNVKVLAVDQTARTDDNDPVVVRAVTLEVTPKQAEVLVARKEEGSIQLTLRNPLENVVAQEPVKPAPKKKAVRRVRRTPTDTTIIVIKGTTVNKTKVKI
jgi:pilus assembly protein CpaB